ncbi:unnamed protein product [Bursaphelenchus xylophilus]|uniref:(pine wood nematode) hypothetical protein n=1 Tax=Bursaphelenchus xylophilus TaxID=6326 RepID=A0A1I7SWS3_BURXY|nr:unnamed protein product [Bursaphelenchus xylophilus]CAG9099865.1 unnamed protein product [Bursaphelenchus xylophilus]
MFHLAPVGLDGPSRVKRDKHQTILNDIKVTVKECLRFGQNEIPGREIEAVELLRALDAFLAHGFKDPPKCYWFYVKEFIPKSAQADLQIEWRTSDERKLSIGWLKSTLNNKTLYFEFLSFVAQPKLMKKYYEKNAAVRNQALLKLVAVGVEPLNNVNFKFLSPAMRESQEVPIAQLSSQAPIIHVPSSTAIQPRSIPRRRLDRPGVILSASVHAADSSASFRVGSFDHPGPREDREEEDEDLPRVEVPQTANEPFLSTTRDQEYILDAMVKNHRTRIQSSARFETDSDEAHSEEEVVRKMSSSPSKLSRRRSQRNRERSVDVAIPSSPSSSTSSGIKRDIRSSKSNDEEGKVEVEAGEDDVKSEELQETKEEGKEAEEENVLSEEVKAESLREAIPDEPIEGNLQLISGEIVSLAMEVFHQDSERYQAMYSVYINHSVGEPQHRFLLVTDQCIYLLKAEIENEKGQDQFYSSSLNFAASRFDSSRSIENMSPVRNLSESNHLEGSNHDGVKYTYRTETYLSLKYLDCISVGLNAQTLCFHSTSKQIFFSNPKRREKQFQVETASQKLGELIVFKLSAIIKAKFNHSMAIDRNQNTFSSIILHNFVRKELGLPQVEIKQANLIYWLQSLKETDTSAETMESYLYARNVYPNAWRKKTDEWVQSYFILREHMLYQFTDSTCKEAIASVDLRQKVELVEQVLLKNDENFVFQITLIEEPFIQFSFETMDEMNKWLSAITMAVSSSHASELDAVACLLVATDATLLFVQEGANFLVDGFVRCLHKMSICDIHAISSAKTPSHRILAIQRESGNSEWLFFRNDSELHNFINFVLNEWGMQIEEHGEGWMETDSVHGKIYRQCQHRIDFF